MKALVLAGGFPQIALIKELKNRNIYVLLADWGENPVAKEYADEYHCVSTLDIEAITDLVKSKKVDFLITVCTDQALLTVAKVSETLGLPCYIDYQTGLNVTNKSYMKKVFKSKGITTAAYEIVNKYDAEVLKTLCFPLIVKPVDCNSSKGVKKVNCEEELKNAIADAVGFSRTKTAVVEQFVSGTEISVDLYVEDGLAKILCISNNDKIKDKNKFIIFRGVSPAREYDQVKDQIQIEAQKIVDAFNLKNTPMLIQFIYDGKKVYVLEFSARTGGGTKFLRILNNTGFDVINAVIDLTLGKKPHVKKERNEDVYLADEFIYCKPGVFGKLEGFDKLKEDGIIRDYYLFKKSGALFTGVESSGDRIAGFTVVADSFENLKKKHDIVASHIKVLDINGEDMMRHDLLTEID